MNRLEDSYVLWRLVCASKLLARTQIILFLNKCDLLDQKLKSGTRVRDYVRSFGDRSNDVDTVSKCERPVIVWSIGRAMMSDGAPSRQTSQRISRRYSSAIPPSHDSSACT